MKKIVLFAFNGEPMCFVHALLTALDMNERKYDVKLVIEGTATKLVEKLADREAQFADLYARVKEKKLIDCVCRACSHKTGSLMSAEEQGLPICAELKGHPSMARYIDEGFEVITF
jgi:hypothetical protein